MKYRVYASIYHIPEEGTVKAHMIVVVDNKGKLVDSMAGPATIDGYEGRFTEKKARESARDCIKERMEIKVNASDVELVPYERLGKMLFKLQNK